MIIYIHGFNSAGKGSKFNKLKEMFPDINIISPTYDSSNFSTIDTMLDDYQKDIDQADNLLFIGNSLGGYIAMYLANKYNGKCLILNPLVDINDLKQFVGYNTNFVTDKRYFLSIDNILYLQKYKIDYSLIPLTIYVTEDDDILDYKKTLTYFDKKQVNVFKTGTHRFDCLENIKDNILYEYFNTNL